MKKIALILALCVTASISHAGQRYQPTKTYQETGARQAGQWFGDREFSLDLYGFWQDAKSAGNPYSDGWGGGLGLNAFFTRHIGLGLEADWSDQTRDSTVIHSVTSTIIGRYPIGRVAPYALVGVGGRFDSKNVANFQAGGGLEIRVTRNVGLFTDARHIWNEGYVNDVRTIRTGVRFAF